MLDLTFITDMIMKCLSEWARTERWRWWKEHSLEKSHHHTTIHCSQRSARGMKSMGEGKTGSRCEGAKRYWHRNPMLDKWRAMHMNGGSVFESDRIEFNKDFPYPKIAQPRTHLQWLPLHGAQCLYDWLKWMPITMAMVTACVSNQAHTAILCCRPEGRAKG